MAVLVPATILFICRFSTEICSLWLSVTGLWTNCVDLPVQSYENTLIFIRGVPEGFRYKRVIPRHGSGISENYSRVRLSDIPHEKLLHKTVRERQVLCQSELSIRIIMEIRSHAKPQRGEQLTTKSRQELMESFILLALLLFKFQMWSYSSSWAMSSETKDKARFSSGQVINQKTKTTASKVCSKSHGIKKVKIWSVILL